MLGGLYLLAARIISWHIPVAFLGTLFAIAGIFHLIDPAHYAAPLFHWFAGAAMLGAFFILTDPVSSPTTNKGRLIYAAGAALLTYLIRTFGGFPDGVAFATLLMNICVPLIVLYTQPNVFGKKDKDGVLAKGQAMRRTIAKASVITALNLLFFALIGTALLALTYQLTHEPIARSEEQEKLKLVTQIAPRETYDNDIIKDTAQLAADELLGNDDTTVAYLGRLKGRPSIAVLQVIAPDGYSGKISLIICDPQRWQNRRRAGNIATRKRRAWAITSRSRRANGSPASTANRWTIPKTSDWKVKKDGGAFDYMAGATITPRAVVKAVHKALQYFAQHRDEMFKPHAPAKVDAVSNEGEKK